MTDLASLKYTAEHEWIALDGDTATVGITDYAADKLGDVVYVDLPAAGASVSAGDVCGEIESTTYPGSTPADLEETERLLKETGRRAVLSQADVRDYEQVEAAFTRGLELDRPAVNAALTPSVPQWTN